MSSDNSVSGGYENNLTATHRKDGWWIGPLLTLLGLAGFGLYSTWAAFQGQHYYAAPYLSPFYSPVIFLNEAALGAADHSILGAFPHWWPAFVPQSPAFLILMFPGAFRVTCYYYRQAYYRSFFATPLGCAVNGKSQKKYKGETNLLLWQNLHRYALYFALVFIVILYYDAILAFFKKDADGVSHFGVGVGSIVLLLNASFLAFFTFGCNSLRHLVGGGTDNFEKSNCGSCKMKMWLGVSFFNRKHKLWAWVSFLWVGFTDIYVRMVSMGIWTDFNTWSF